MNAILFDDDKTIRLRPFTLSRPAALIRCGILTLAEKWNQHLETVCSYRCADYLSAAFPENRTEDNFFINGRYFPDKVLAAAIMTLTHGQSIYDGDVPVALRAADLTDLPGSERQAFTGNFTALKEIHNIFTFNHSQIALDFELICAGRSSAPLSVSNTVIGKHPVFAEEGVYAEAAVFNTTEGPIYLGKGSEVMEGSLVRGPFALCEGSSLKMGAKIYNGTTIGPHSKVGGEVSNSVIFGYSNKGHDGFLGNSVLGEWCNIGADSNNSNLKNNYEIVKLWNYETERFEKTGLQFCGLFMGDHSKCGINTMFNTGTVVGVSCNIFGTGFPRNFVPSFSWGGAQGFDTYTTAKAYQTAELVMQRRGKLLREEDKQVLNHIFHSESKFRN